MEKYEKSKVKQLQCFKFRFESSMGKIDEQDVIGTVSDHIGRLRMRGTRWEVIDIDIEDKSSNTSGYFIVKLDLNGDCKRINVTIEGITKMNAIKCKIRMVDNWVEDNSD
jgi:hypothetical protein